MSVKIKCPLCKGSGKSKGYISPNESRQQPHICYQCNGNGSIVSKNHHQDSSGYVETDPFCMPAVNADSDFQSLPHPQIKPMTPCYNCQNNSRFVMFCHVCKGTGFITFSRDKANQRQSIKLSEMTKQSESKQVESMILHALPCSFESLLEREDIPEKQIILAVSRLKFRGKIRQKGSILEAVQ